MPPAGYDKVCRSLALLAPLASRARGHAPLLCRAPVACEIDGELAVHVLRAGDRADGPAELRALERARIAPDATAVVWQAFGPRVFNARALWLAAPSPSALVVAVGTRAASEDALHLERYEALVVGEAGAQTVLAPVRAGVRVAAAEDGNHYLVAPAWFGPPVSPSALPLRLVRLEPGGPRVLANPVSGSDAFHSYPSDVALVASSRARLELVYDGVRDGASPHEPRLYHLTLDAETGAVERALDLGPAPPEHVLTRVVAAPDGRLHVFVVRLTRASEGVPRLERACIALEAHASGGARAEHYFVDPWMQAHVLWFDAEGVHMHGPDGLPPSAPGG